MQWMDMGRFGCRAAERDKRARPGGWALDIIPILSSAKWPIGVGGVREVRALLRGEPRLSRSSSH